MLRSWCLVLVLVAAACGGPTASGTPTAPPFPTPPVETLPPGAYPTAPEALATPGASLEPGASATPEGSASPMPTPTPTPTRSPIVNGEFPLAELLGLLVVAEEMPAGYDRDLFRHWIDEDGDGCSARAEVLIAEAQARPSIGDRCALVGGRWWSLYDERTFTNASEIDIDHVVALKEAWDSGAHAWSAARRQAFANELRVPWALIAVSASSNRSKSDRDPAQWLPPAAAARCPYLAAWMAVKVRFALTIDTTERNALRELVVGCPTTTAPVQLAP